MWSFPHTALHLKGFHLGFLILCVWLNCFNSHFLHNGPLIFPASRWKFTLLLNLLLIYYDLTLLNIALVSHFWQYILYRLWISMIIVHMKPVHYMLIHITVRGSACSFQYWNGLILLFCISSHLWSHFHFPPPLTPFTATLLFAPSSL